MMHEIEMSLKGYFKIEATNEAGERRTLADWFPNLITNAGLELIKRPSYQQGQYNFLNVCRLGSNGSAPTVNDTVLGAQIGYATTAASTTIGSNNLTTSPRFTSVIQTFTFGKGAASGNVAEIGVSPTTDQELFSRALIVDSNGNPTTITVLANEILTVTYELRLYFNESVTTTTFTLGTTTYMASAMTPTYNANAAWLLNYVGGIQGDGFNAVYASADEVGTPGSGTPNNDASGYGTFASFTDGPVGSYYRDYTLHFDIDRGNFTGGIASITPPSDTRGSVFPKVGFSPHIMKNNTQTLDVVVRISWGRYAP